MCGLDDILESLRSLSRELVSRGARAVAVFGSAARGVDFIPCRSDVDVLAVVSEKRDHLEPVESRELGYKVSLALYTARELESLVERVHPVLLHIYKASIVFFDDGTLSSALARLPSNVPRSTIEIEETSTVVALALGAREACLQLSRESTRPRPPRTAPPG